MEIWKLTAGNSLLLPAAIGRLWVVEGYFLRKGRINMKKYYIAYGSNLNVQQMRYRCPDARIVGTSVIADYQLLFKGSKTGSYLTIEKKKGGSVPVGVWEVSERDELRLDAVGLSKLLLQNRYGTYSQEPYHR